ncbi:ABC transporter permease [Cohnella sp.]|uniref:ABC transporter permease n=1 Tax=Cohnella sp. TaxID=1883426 RepID=UPI0035671463
MRIALEVAWNEAVRLCRIRTVILMLLGLPLLLIFLLGNALQSDLEPVRVSVSVGDRGAIGEAAERYLTSPAITGYVDAQHRASEAEVREDMRAGAADFGFALTEAGVRYYPGQFIERNMIAESVLNRFVADANVRLSASVLAPGLSGEAVEQSLSAAYAKERVQIGTLLSRDSVGFDNFSAVQYYSVAYLVMFLLYSGMSAALSLTEERERGTLLRLYSMPVSLNVLLLGKLMGFALFACLQAIVIVGFTQAVYGVDWGVSYASIALVCVLVSAAAIGFAIIVCSFVRNRRAIESIFSLVIVAMTFLSGGMIADIGSGLREIGKFTINHWANEVLRILMAGGTMGEGWREALVLVAIAAAVVTAAMLRFRKAVALA